ncbi:MAG: CDP-alcohol phosphatidyltransferase family protein [Anaerolineae bacterium]|nr:MAG: CDP-alcohol phosphatidyltransferase family protein [Anaerolineae bacterium]
MDQTQPATFSDLARARLKGVMDAIALFLDGLGVTADMLTLAGFGGHIFGAILVGLGYLRAAGFVLLFLAPLDALDGSLARLRGEPSKFGAFLDSVVDRYSEMLLFAGFLVYFLRRFDQDMVLWVFAAAAGSILVSYTRARGEALGYEVRRGFLTRFERYLIIIPTLILTIPKIGIIIIAIFANFTAVQRFLHVRRQARERESF